MAKHKAITINPITQTIAEVLMDDADQLAQFYSHIQCQLVEAHDLPNGDTVWMDEEGLFVQGQSFFAISDLLDGQPIAGIVVVTGTIWDQDGDKLKDCESTVEELNATVCWLARI